MKPIHINEENSFETIEINGIPALYTMSRIDRKSLPIGFYAYDIRSCDDDEHGTIEKAVFVNHTATIITLVPIEMTDEDYTIVENINFIDQTDNYEIWRDKVFEQLAESGEWIDRAIEFLELHSDAHIGDIIGFVNEYWQNLNTDEENQQDFYNFIINNIKEELGEPQTLECCYIKDGQLVYWKDPANETSGLYKVQGNYEPYEDNTEEDDRIIDIANSSGSQAQVYPCELYIIKSEKI
ncbi:MAG: hypothetical protein LBI60_04745 [Bacteroidales bacterium]|jgi:hypothetical protein|nr:hypothetical protein [Bacteroidales bacterium]